MANKMPFAAIRHVIIMEPLCDLNLITRLQERHISVTLIRPDSTISNYDFETDIFLIQDYENSKWSFLREKAVVVGPPYIRACLAQINSSWLPLPRTSLYGKQLSNCTLLIKVHRPKSEQVHAYVSQMYWRAKNLGATVVKQISAEVTHLLTDRTFGKDYTIAKSLGKIVVLPSWITDIWENHRERIDLSDKDPLLLKKHALPIFMGITIHFVAAPTAEILQAYILKARNAGAMVTGDPSLATHVVVFDEDRAYLSRTSRRQFFISVEWFDESISFGGARNAESFQVLSNKHNEGFHYPQSSLSRISSASERSRCHSFPGATERISTEIKTPSLMEDGVSRISLTSSPSKNELMMQVYAELVHHETNYVKSLRLLNQLNTEIRDELKKKQPHAADWMVPQGYCHDIHSMLSKIPSILAVHEAILEKIEDLMLAPDTDYGMADIWVEFHGELARVYPPFVNLYNPAKFTSIYENLLVTNPVYAQIIRKAESQPIWERHQVKDRLILPVQHLCQTLMIFNNGIKNATAANKSSKRLSEAAKTVETILKCTNRSRGEIENFEKHFRALKEIRDLPPCLISYNQRLITSASLRLLGGSETWANERRPMRLFLLDDCLIICKIRRDEATGTLRRLRSAIFSDETADQSMEEFCVPSAQKIRYQLHCSLDRIRSIDALGVVQAPVYVLVIRQDQSDIELTFVAESNQDSAENIRMLMEAMRQQIIHLYGRDPWKNYDHIAITQYPSEAVINTLKQSQLLSRSQISLTSDVISLSDRVSLYSQKIGDDSGQEFNRRMSLQENCIELPPGYAAEKTRRHGKIRRTLSNISLALTRPFRRNPNQPASAVCSRTNSICGALDSPTVSIECFKAHEMTRSIAGLEHLDIEEEDEQEPIGCGFPTRKSRSGKMEKLNRHYPASNYS